MTDNIELVVHITHEAGVKVGGIGAVLNGLLGAQAYKNAFERTIIVGPLNVDSPSEMERLFDPSNDLRLRYAAPLSIDTLSPELSQQFQAIERIYNVQIYYGKRPFRGVFHEVLLINVADIIETKLNDFKYLLWDKFGLDCGQFEFDPEFRRFVNLAEPAYAALYHLATDISGPRVLLSHEWMGMPLVLAALMKDPGDWFTAFYAHEVATARLLVEEHPGHDTRFYNTMHVAQDEEKSIDAVFGDQSYYYKHVLLRLAAVCDGILAVGDLVMDELRFLGGDYRFKEIDLVYNGVPSFPITLEEKQRSKSLLQTYTQNLLGFSPDFVFSHVTRFVTSKGMWRDIRVLNHLDVMLSLAGKEAVLFILSSFEPTGRSAAQVHLWEQDYGWPVNHRADNHDLLGHEVDFYYDVLEPFNRKSQAIKAVLINQFGWSQDRCGKRMPVEMNFMDLRKGADLEFGQSIYEPFGIAQVEPLSFGALCVVSNVCGCVGFVEGASSDLPEFPNLVVADYITPPPDWTFQSTVDAMQLDKYGRDLIEISSSQVVAKTIAARLPLNDEESEELLALGQKVGSRMSWEVVVKDYLLPALSRAMDVA